MLDMNMQLIFLKGLLQEAGNSEYGNEIRVIEKYLGNKTKENFDFCIDILCKIGCNFTI
jgi:hypothetical protein